MGVLPYLLVPMAVIFFRTGGGFRILTGDFRLLHGPLLKFKSYGLSREWTGILFEMRGPRKMWVSIPFYTYEYLVDHWEGTNIRTSFSEKKYCYKGVTTSIDHKLNYWYDSERKRCGW